MLGGEACAWNHSALAAGHLIDSPNTTVLRCADSDTIGRPILA